MKCLNLVVQSVLIAVWMVGYPVSLSRQSGLSSAPNPVSAQKVKADFSTPRATIKTFIAAGAARNLDLLSQCFADNAPAEFDGLRKKTAGKEELDQLAEFVQGAKVANVVMTGNKTTANVAVRFKSRKENIKVIKTVDGWRIVDF